MKKKKIIVLIISAACSLSVCGCQFFGLTATPGISSEVSSNDSESGQYSEPEATPTPTMMPTAEPTIPDPTPTTPVPTVTPSFIPENLFVYINVGTANLREKPTTQSAVIKSLHYRTRVRRIGTTGEWAKVITENEETGYIYAEFLSTAIPKITPTPAPAKVFGKWPSVASISGFYSADLTQYKGRTLGVGYEPLKGITVILDPGHGGGDSGAVYTNKNTNTTVMEKIINLSVSLKVGTELEKMGAKVIYTRKDDSTVSLYARNAKINKFILEKHKELLTEQNKETKDTDRLISLMQAVIDKNSDVESTGGRGIFRGLGAAPDLRTIMDISREYADVAVISIHCNAFPDNSSAAGLEIYYGTGSAIYSDEKLLMSDEPASNPLNPSYQFYNDSARRKFAAALRDDIRTQISMASRGPSDSLFAWNFCLLRENNLTSSLVELGFITNSKDRNLLTDPTGQKMLALGIAQGVYSYYCKE